MDPEEIEIDADIIEEAEPVPDPLDEVRGFMSRLQFNLQVLLSTLVLENQAPSLLAASPAERNNFMRSILAQQLDAIVHVMEHINNAN